ncbi:hypothetical protein BH23VER1_BH23VER1_20140 [soil metagenome]
MTTQFLTLSALGIASAALVVLNMVRATAAPPAVPQTLAHAADPADPTTPAPADPDPLASVEAQLEAFRQKILRSVQSEDPSLDPEASPLLQLSAMPTLTFPQPPIWREFEVNGETFQINPLDQEIAGAD